MSFRDRLAWLSKSCFLCPWGETCREPPPDILADSAHRPALLASLCFFRRSQCHLLWNRMILNFVSFPKNKIPVLCTEPWGASPDPGPYFVCALGPCPPGQNQEPVDWTGVDAQPSSPSWIPFPGGLEVEFGESSVGPRAEDV